MKAFRHMTSLPGDGRPRVVTLGNFDGVHRGHQEIVRRAASAARAVGGVTVAVTFQPHPTAVLYPERAPLSLGGLRQKLHFLEENGADFVVVQHFTRKFALVTAEQFVRDHLVGALRMRELVVGHRVGFGHNRSGNAELLIRMGEELGFGVEIIPPVQVEGKLVSSSAIRQTVQAGDLETAAAMLGRPYLVEGRVREGFRRGRTIGVPTANLRLRGIQLPPDGVYAVKVVLRDGSLHGGVANLGFAPTFGGSVRTLEAHLFDFDRDLYGERIGVRFVRFLRGEKKFADLSELKQQIERDAAEARRILCESP